ncbi:MAG: hypothetical protein ABMB14_24730, partial [Myxococcota bacterium]
SVDGAPAASLADALAAATDGAVVDVCPTTHTGPFTATVPVHLVTSGASGQTVLVGGGGRVLSVPGGSSITGFTLRDGLVAGPGGALLLSSAGTLDIDGCEFVDNAADSGGAIAAPDGGIVTIAGSTIHDNVARLRGGGLYLVGGSVDLTTSSVTANEADSSGGGIHAEDSAVIGGEIADNALTGFAFWSGSTGSAYELPSLLGGGIGAIGEVSVTGAIVTGNAADFGAGIGVIDGVLTLTGVRIEANQTGPTGTAGGVMCWNSACTFDETTEVVGNQADTAGGVIVGFGTLTGGVIDANTATLYGGGLVVEAGEAAEVEVTGNTGPNGGGVAVIYDAAVRSCAITGNTADEGAGISQIFPSFELTLTVADCEVSGNVAAGDGGGLLIYDGARPIDVTLEGNTFADNAAARGAGAFFGRVDATVTGDAFVRNAAASEGGAVWLGAGGLALVGVDLGVGVDDNAPGDVFAGGVERVYDGVTDTTCDAGGCSP